MAAKKRYLIYLVRISATKGMSFSMSCWCVILLCYGAMSVYKSPYKLVFNGYLEDSRNKAIAEVTL